MPPMGKGLWDYPQDVIWGCRGMFFREQVKRTCTGYLCVFCARDLGMSRNLPLCGVPPDVTESAVRPRRAAAVAAAEAVKAMAGLTCDSDSQAETSDEDYDPDSDAEEEEPDDFEWPVHVSCHHLRDPDDDAFDEEFSCCEEGYCELEWWYGWALWPRVV